MTALPDLVVDRVGGELGSVSSWHLATFSGSEALGDPPPSSPDLSTYRWFHQTSCALSQPSNTPASRFDPEKCVAGFSNTTPDDDSSDAALRASTEPATVLARPTERRTRTRRSSGRRGHANVRRSGAGCFVQRCSTAVSVIPSCGGRPREAVDRVPLDHRPSPSWDWVPSRSRRRRRAAS